MDYLACKSLGKLQEPDYYKRPPEFDETTEALRERFQRVVDRLAARRKMEVEYVEKKKLMDDDYARQLYHVSEDQLLC